MVITVCELPVDKELAALVEKIFQNCLALHLHHPSLQKSEYISSWKGTKSFMLCFFKSVKLMTQFYEQLEQKLF